MSAFLYGVVLQCKLDIRSKSLLVTCYLVPLLFFAFMGGIFTSITPEMKDTLIQSMTVMGVTMGAFLGLPPTLLETYNRDVKKAYKANGVPLYAGLVSMFISSFFHLMIMSIIIFLTAPFVFHAQLPENLVYYFISLAMFIAVSLSLGCVLGMVVIKQSKLAMVSQVIFLPSIMLSGILFPAALLPEAFTLLGKLFPATWGFQLMLDGGFQVENILVMVGIFIIGIVLVLCLLKRHYQE